jgi:hypothetical protein
MARVFLIIDRAVQSARLLADLQPGSGQQPPSKPLVAATQVRDCGSGLAHKRTRSAVRLILNGAQRLRFASCHSRRLGAASTASVLPAPLLGSVLRCTTSAPPHPLAPSRATDGATSTNLRARLNHPHPWAARRTQCHQERVGRTRRQSGGCRRCGVGYNQRHDACPSCRILPPRLVDDDSLTVLGLRGVRAQPREQAAGGALRPWGHLCPLGRARRQVRS